MSQNTKKMMVLCIFILFIFLIILFSILLDKPGLPVTFTSETGQFTITLPTKPKLFSRHFSAPYGQVEINGLTSDANGIQFSLTCFKFSKSFPTSPELFHEDTQVDLSAETFYARRRTIENKGYTAVETKAKYLDGYLIYTREIHFLKRRYALQAITRKDDQSHHNQIQKVFNSLTFLELAQK
ncbi:MAG: hypothetical protein ACYST2_05560 [Planctomycetota bacterium]|jgi:hypothetical protein